MYLSVSLYLSAYRDVFLVSMKCLSSVYNDVFECLDVFEWLVVFECLSRRLSSVYEMSFKCL